MTREFISKLYYNGHSIIDLEDVIKLMEDFAKYHVDQALETASLVDLKWDGLGSDPYVDEEGILDCYPESNIKVQ